MVEITVYLPEISQLENELGYPIDEKIYRYNLFSQISRALSLALNWKDGFKTLVEKLLNFILEMIGIYQ